MLKQLSTKVIVAAMIGLAMCSQEDPGQNNVKPVVEFKYSPDRSVRFNGRYLEFSSPAVLEDALTNFNNNKAKALQKWFAEIGFESQMSLYKQVTDEQAAIMKGYEDKFKGQDLSTITAPQYVPGKLASDNAKLFLHNEFGLVTRLSLFNSQYANVVNKEGLLKVAGHLFQYTPDALKIIEDGDDAKIGFLEQTLETDASRGIIVNKVEPVKTAANGRYDYHTSVQDVFSSFAAHRITGWVDLATYYYPIYGSQVCDGGCDVAQDTRMQNVECYCYYPIIGYDTRTVYQIQQLVEIRQVFWWAAHACTHSQILWKYTKNGQQSGLNSMFGGFDFANIWVTIYDGPQANFSYGYNVFSAQHNLTNNCNCPYLDWAVGSTFQD